MKYENAGIENINKEVLHIAENLLQLHYSRIRANNSEYLSPTHADSTTNRETLARETIESGDGFRNWFNSSEGKAIMHEYVRNHTLNQIGTFVDMEKLVELYLEFKNRTLH